MLALMQKLTCLAALLLVGCGGPWTVVKQASPNPFTAQTAFFVAPTTWNNLRIGTKDEAEWLAGKKPETQQTHTNDKLAFSTRFQQMMVTKARGLAIQPAPEGRPAPGWTVRSNIHFFEPGFYAVVAQAPTQVRLTVDFVDPNGQLADQIEVKDEMQPQIPKTPIVLYTVTERLLRTAEGAAMKVTRYMRKRCGLPQ
jgi:hypothetical protein